MFSADGVTDGKEGEVESADFKDDADMKVNGYMLSGTWLLFSDRLKLEY